MTTTDAIDCAEILNDVFSRQAGRRFHAHPTQFMTQPALRIVYRNMPLASPHADLIGEDRRNLASAFIKAGCAVGESLRLLEKANGPALYIECYSPPADMHWAVTGGRMNPWSLHLLRLDAGYLKIIAPALDDAMRVRFN